MLDYKQRQVRQSFYNSKEWKEIRLYVLTNEPLCRNCSKNFIIKEATVVDHIIDIAESPELRLDFSNLQPLCTQCHNSKTATKTNLSKKNNQGHIVRVWKEF